MSIWGLFRKRRKRSPYSKGISAERRVKRGLENKGWLVRQSKGSRGPYDLYALKGGMKMLIQVKSGTASASRSEIRRLRKAARSKGAKGLVIHVRGKKKRSRFVY
jgi:Holliday junction resolvase